jgi:long-chain acyl-CoA synthetase
VVVETRPGRIEAIVLAPGVHGLPRAGDPIGYDPAMPPDDVRASIDGAVREANAHLGPNQRLAGWRLWPDSDFPRTHTLKVKRDRVRAWASVEAPLPVR